MRNTPGVLGIMMPIYNEARTLETILAHVLARPEVGEVIAVDDGSEDDSWEILTRIATLDPRLRPFRQPYNQGKGSALRRAISELRMPFALVQDADLEYDPRDFPLLLEPLLEGRADVVYGVRGFAGQTAYSYLFVVGNWGVTTACNALFDCYISDINTCYKALRSDLWRRLNMKGTGFDGDVDITARVLRLGYRIHEVPVHYYARAREEGKKLTWKDGVHAIATLLKVRLSSHARLFGSPTLDDYHLWRREELSRHHPLMWKNLSQPFEDARTRPDKHPRH
jgi:glycosyltransferase involved in cell wall biosynthesis